MLDDFDKMRAMSQGGVLVTSDVTGMDFSLGGLALAACCYATLCKSEANEQFDRTAMAYAYAEAAPMYPHYTARLATEPARPALTSDVDSQGRAIDTILKEGVIIDGVRRPLDPNWKSPLVERDVKVSIRLLSCSPASN